MADKELLGLIEDVNPTEIASHIEAGGLHTWCKAWRNAAKSCLATKSCDFCKGRAYTKKPMTIITAYGKRFQMVFEHCPNCGRKLRAEDGK